MATKKHKFSNKSKAAFLIIAALFSVMTPACGNKTDGDIDAYCALIAKNLDLGIPDSNLPVEELDLLIALSPSKIKKAVTKIRNTSADIAEISEIDQLFAATFDPEAVSAQNAFQDFNTQNCDINTQEVADLVSTTQNAAQSELDDFLTVNYSAENWYGNVQTTVIFKGIEVIGAEGRFPADALSPDQESLCLALSLWLYAVKEREGKILVYIGERRVIQRDSEKAYCQSSEIVSED